MRLSLLTGARANEILSLRCGDILGLDGGTPEAIATGTKNDSAPRIIPLHDFARRVVKARLADLPDTGTDAPLFPEVPAEGYDNRRSKAISTRFPDIRRRILGPDDGADWHSFRRSFLTACETALHNGGRLNPQNIALLAGHKRPELALSLYSDWAKMGRHRQSPDFRRKLQTLQDAVDDVVRLGFATEVLAALEITAGCRPPMTRTQPLFRRNRPVVVKRVLKLHRGDDPKRPARKRTMPLGGPREPAECPLVLPATHIAGKG